MNGGPSVAPRLAQGSIAVCPCRQETAGDENRGGRAGGGAVRRFCYFYHCVSRFSSVGRWLVAPRCRDRPKSLVGRRGLLRPAPSFPWFGANFSRLLKYRLILRKANPDF